MKTAKIPNVYAQAARVLELGIPFPSPEDEPNRFACHALTHVQGVMDTPEAGQLHLVMAEPTCIHAAFLSCTCVWPLEAFKRDENHREVVSDEMLDAKILALCFMAAMHDAGDLPFQPLADG